MKEMPFVQVYDVSISRLRSSIDFHLRMVEQSTSTPLEQRRQLGEAVHWIAGAIHQWWDSLLFLCEVSANPGLERSAITAKVEVDRRALELEVATTVERMKRGRR